MRIRLLRRSAVHAHRAFSSTENTALAWLLIFGLMGMLVVEYVQERGDEGQTVQQLECCAYSAEPSQD